jgi:hypothetical protein
MTYRMIVKCIISQDRRCSGIQVVTASWEVRTEVALVMTVLRSGKVNLDTTIGIASYTEAKR